MTVVKNLNKNDDCVNHDDNNKGEEAKFKGRLC